MLPAPGASVVYPYAQYGFGNAFLEQIVTNGRADYDALQTRAQRRFANGFAFTTAYTYSKALGDFLDHLSAGGGATGNFPRDAYNMGADYGPLPFDIRHRLSASFIYELPFGPGRAFNPGGVAGAVVGGWAVNGILSLNSGRPFSVSATDRAGTGVGRRAAADCIADPLPSGFNQTNDQWFDVTAFAAPAISTYGNCGYNTVYGPSSKSMNLSLFRSISFSEHRRVELRVESFNLFNWVNYGFPGMSASNLATFGRIRARKAIRVSCRWLSGFTSSHGSTRSHLATVQHWCNTVQHGRHLATVQHRCFPDGAGECLGYGADWWLRRRS